MPSARWRCLRISCPPRPSSLTPAVRWRHLRLLCSPRPSALTPAAWRHRKLRLPRCTHPSALTRWRCLRSSCPPHPSALTAPFSAPPLDSHAGGTMALSLELDICLILRLPVMPSAPLTPLALSCAPRAPHTLPHKITYTTLWPLPLLSLFALYRPPAPLSLFALFRAPRASVSV